MRYFILFFVLWATAPFAQSFPDYETITVNDYADLLPPSAEAAMAARLEALRAETGVEMTVLTMDSQAPYAPTQSMEAFATALFNHWGIGDADRNDGVLVMVLQGDRAMRIELGAGYGRAWDREAEYIVDNDFLPNFRRRDYETGIVTGVDAVIAEIVEPFVAGDPRPRRQAEERRKRSFLFAILGSMATLGLAVFAFAGRLIKRFRTCPNCGQGGLNKVRIVDQPASYVSAGSGRHHFYCDHCDYDDVQPFVIPMRVHRQSTGSGSGGFGGGSSGGGGASGRW